MELKFSPSVAQIQKVSYAKEAEEKFLLDCGDGCSPYGCSEKVAQALREAHGVCIQANVCDTLTSTFQLISCKFCLLFLPIWQVIYVF